jgi:hypothetical protein
MDEGEWSASRLGRFTPAERISLTLLIGEYLGLRASLDTFDERYVLLLPRIKPRTVQPITSYLQ